MKTIAVLMGGPSSEHDISLLTGANVFRALKERYHAIPIFVSLAGEWFYGQERKHMLPHAALMNVDLVFNAMHGEYGEDGKVQSLLDTIDVRYTGSGALASALAMNKEKAGFVLRSAGLNVPAFFVLHKHDQTDDLVERARMLSAPPWVVKPLRRGSSVGVSIARTTVDLPTAVAAAFKYDDQILIQELIKGRELTCGVLQNYSGEQAYALPPVEIIPPSEATFFDYAVKYNGKTTEICPADFHDAMLSEIRRTAVTAHFALGCSGYSRTDMILRGTRIHVLELNTLPGLTKESLFPKAAIASGLEFSQLLDHIIDVAVS